MDKGLYRKKIMLIIIGSIISAYGITLAMFSGFGSATLAVLWQGIAKTMNITLGQASLVAAVFMIIFGLIYDCHQLGVGTILYQVIYGYFVDVFTAVHYYPENEILCFLIMCLGIIIFAIGTGIYCTADLGRGSYDIVSFAIAEKCNYQIRYVRMGVDIAVVLIGMILGGNAGMCTIITILFAGNVIQLTIKMIKQYFPNLA